jgi:hypothetical protein
MAKTSIVRYDAYKDTGGHQSASVALLDGGRSGIVVGAGLRGCLTPPAARCSPRPYFNTVRSGIAPPAAFQERYREPHAVKTRC